MIRKHYYSDRSLENCYHLFLCIHFFILLTVHMTEDLPMPFLYILTRRNNKWQA